MYVLKRGEANSNGIITFRFFLHVLWKQIFFELDRIFVRLKPFETRRERKSTSPGLDEINFVNFARFSSNEISFVSIPKRDKFVNFGISLVVVQGIDRCRITLLTKFPPFRLQNTTRAYKSNRILAAINVRRKFNLRTTDAWDRITLSR